MVRFSKFKILNRSTQKVTNNQTNMNLFFPCTVVNCYVVKWTVQIYKQDFIKCTLLLHCAMGSSFPVFSLVDCQIFYGSHPMRNQDLISQEAPIVRFSGLTFHASYVNLWNILLTDLPARLFLLDTCLGTPWTRTTVMPCMPLFLKHIWINHPNLHTYMFVYLSVYFNWTYKGYILR